MKTNIGKNTLGDNNRMSVELREYGRSTHDLSYAWRSTMGVGSLVPFMKVLALPGDTININLDTKILTHPTIGPLFGSFKFQADIFTCPIRLYNAQLHNNKLGIGLDMKKVKLPKLSAAAEGYTNSSSIFNYLGIKYTDALEKKNAVPFLGVFDIFKNYYANKQEEKFYVLNQSTTEQHVSLGTDNVSNATINPSKQKIVTLAGMGLLESDISIKIINPRFEAKNIKAKNSYINVHLLQEIGGLNTGTNGRLYLNQTGVKIKNDNDGNLLIDVKYDPAVITFTKTPTDDAEGGQAQMSSVILAVAESLQMDAINLTDIDDLREDILSVGNQEYIIGEGGNCNVESFNELVKNMNQGGSLTGLPLKTHMSDIFNNWINTEWIDGDNGISKLTAIDTSSGSFTIDTLNLTEKVYNLLNRIAISGGTYKDWIETVYTTDYYFRAETPVYEGGMSCEIEFGEVVSTSATEIENNEPLGTLAGKGYASNKKGGTVTIKINEPCYIIGLASITPRVDYSQGEDWDNELDNLDDLHKPQLDGIGYQDLMSKWMHAGANKNSSIGKTIAWVNYMTNFNKTYGNFAAGENEAYMVLNRTYELEESEIYNATTYINPSEFLGTFATDTLENQDFWVQIGCGLEMRRVMSAKQIPIM